MTNYYMGQWVAVWQDQRNDYGDIYAQNIQLDGSLGVVGNIPPIADFTWTPSDPSAGESILFDASASYDPDGYIMLYEWDWDHDGVYDESHTTATTTHVWMIPGSYNVSLRITDNATVTSIKTKTISIVNHAPPVPTITGPRNGTVNHEYEFSVGPVVDPEEDPFYCQWDWGDGNISEWSGPYLSGEIVNASHSWASTGIYELRVKLKDQYDAESNWSEPFMLTILDIEVSIDIQGGFGVTVTLTNSGKMEITEIEWTCTLNGGLILLGKLKSGTFESLAPGETTTFKNIPIFGLGKTTIEIEITCAEEVSFTKSVPGTVFLLFVFGIK